MRMNVRYSREREFGEAPWKGMKISCAISSRSVIGFIQRLTVGEALIADWAAAARGGGFLGAAFAGGLAGVAAKAAIAARVSAGIWGRRKLTFSVCQIRWDIAKERIVFYRSGTLYGESGVSGERAIAAADFLRDDGFANRTIGNKTLDGADQLLRFVRALGHHDIGAGVVFRQPERGHESAQQHHANVRI